MFNCDLMHYGVESTKMYCEVTSCAWLDQYSLMTLCCRTQGPACVFRCLHKFQILGYQISRRQTLAATYLRSLNRLCHIELCSQREYLKPSLSDMIL